MKDSRTRPEEYPDSYSYKVNHQWKCLDLDEGYAKVISYFCPTNPDWEVFPEEWVKTYKEGRPIERVTGKHLWISLVLFFFVGIYGGFIQAGTGFLILLVLSGVNQFSLVKSNAIKVVVAFIYTLSALAIFIWNDQVNWKYGLVLSIGNALGGWFASRWSVKKGDGLIKIFLIIMVTAMAIKLWFFTE